MKRGTGSRARRVRAGFRFAVLVPAFLLAVAMALVAQPPGSGKKPADTPKTPPAPSPGVKLPDGTYLWTGPTAPGGDNGERVVISPQELQKLQDQVEQL